MNIFQKCLNTSLLSEMNRAASQKSHKHISTSFFKSTRLLSRSSTRNFSEDYMISSSNSNIYINSRIKSGNPFLKSDIIEGKIRKGNRPRNKTNSSKSLDTKGLYIDDPKKYQEVQQNLKFRSHSYSSDLRNVKKTFTLEDLIAPTNPKGRNLLEVVSQYPNKGINFKVRLPHWPVGKYYVLKKVELGRKEKIFGYLYENFSKKSYSLVEVQEAKTEYNWEYELGKGSVTLDNGVSYTRKCMMPYYLEDTKKKDLNWFGNIQ